MESFQGHINPCFGEAQRFGFKEEEEEDIMQDTVPFLQMLQSEENPSPFFSFKEPNFLTLLSLQNLHKPWELESYHHQQFDSQVQSSMEGTNQALSSQADMTVPSSSSTPNSRLKRKNRDMPPPEVTRGKRKRRKPKPSKDVEEIENQRINHIAVERNRRRQMNEHINSLRSLLPPSYIQRGDQASIVGGAINYAKILEKIIESLESQKRMQQSCGVENRVHEDETCVPRIEATLIQNHVNLKVKCRKKQGQLLKGIVSLEKLRLTVLHLNISSLSHSSVSYSFNLKMEDDCRVESVDEITKVAHQIFETSTL